MAWNVEIEESGEDRKRLEKFVKDHLEEYDVSVREEGNERFLLVDTPKRKVAGDLPIIDREEGKKIDYNITEWEEVDRETEEDLEEDVSTDEKLEDWAMERQREVWSLEEEIEALESQLEEQKEEVPDSIPDAVIHQALTQSEDIKEAEGHAGNIVADEADIFEMAYKGAAEYVANRTDVTVEEARNWVGEIDDATIDELEPEDGEWVNFEGLIGAAEDSQDVPYNVEEAAREYIENDRKRRALEKDIKDAVGALGEIEIPVITKENEYEIILPVGYDQGSMSYLVGSECASQAEKSQEETSEAYDIELEEDSLRIRIERTGHNTVETATDFVRNIYQKGDFSNLNLNIYELRDAEDSFMTYEELSESLTEVQGIGEATAEKTIQELEELDCNNPLKAYIEKPVTIQENVSGMSQTVYERSKDELPQP